MAGRFGAGGVLPPEPVLYEELRVSRTVVRESVKSLVAKGLIQTGPKVGTRVLPSAQWNWFDPDVIAWQARAGLEEGGEYLKFDLRFHQGLLDATHNRMLVQMGEALKALLRTSFEVSDVRQNGPRNSLRLHRAVLDAVISRNPDQAERAVLVLIEAAHRGIELVLKTQRVLPQLNQPAVVSYIRVNNSQFLME